MCKKRICDLMKVKQRYCIKMYTSQSKCPLPPDAIVASAHASNWDLDVVGVVSPLCPKPPMFVCYFILYKIYII